MSFTGSVSAIYPDNETKSVHLPAVSEGTVKFPALSLLNAEEGAPDIVIAAPGIGVWVTPSRICPEIVP